ncbi:MAG: sugar transferase, partial [Clostridia bacterium]
MYKTVKRILDIICSFFAGILLIPVWLVLILCIRADTPGPILFAQKRVGRGKRNFFIYKFRTMRMDTPHDIPTHQLTNPEQYITRCGRFLRTTSLDELPQLWNIFKGDMSLIGPRPALWNQEDLIA